jgi:prepilin-type N-terminal cleavage/methylation domain-containing protein
MYRQTFSGKGKENMNIKISIPDSEGNRGFTLLEILISLIIFAVVISASLLIFKGSVVKYKKESFKKTVYSESSEIFNFIETRLSAAMCNDLTGSYRINFKGGSDWIRFVSPFSQSEDSDLAKFGIYHDQDRIKVSMERIDRDSNDFNFPSGYTGAQVLGQDVGNFTVRYFDGKKWQKSWDTEKMNQPELPEMVRIELEIYAGKIEGEKVEKTFTREFKIR